MNSHSPSRRPGIFGHPVLTATIVLAALVGAGAGSVAGAQRDSATAAPVWHAPDKAAVSATSAAAREKPVTDKPATGGTITLSATGDIMMSKAPVRMPPRDGAGFFDAVRADLKSDLVMGNLEQPLTDDTGTTKCGPTSGPNCFAYRSPPSYARHLVEGGFDLVNTANNHAKDFGVAGYRNTRAALDAAGVRYTGAQDEITVVTVNGIKVAVVGFSPYAGANNMLDLDHTRQVIGQAAARADLVVVQVHMGAEGPTMQHVKPGNETFYGENRGDPITFSHTAIDAGADLVVGHSPHVLRAMEFYRGRLIAYSLGNFAGGGNTLSNLGVLKYGGILRVTLAADGSYQGGSFRSTYLNGMGLPIRDTATERGRALVAELTAADFPQTGAKIADDGSITPSA